MRHKSSNRKHATRPVQRYREAWDYTVARLMELEAIDHVVDMKVKECLAQMFDKDNLPTGTDSKL